MMPALWSIQSARAQINRKPLMSPLYYDKSGKVYYGIGIVHSLHTHSKNARHKRGYYQENYGSVQVWTSLEACVEHV